MWHRAGTITVTKGSKTVTGAGGSEWVQNIRVGDGLQGPDGRLYEVTNVASDTALAIEPAYMGATASGQAYWIIPVLGYQKLLADRAAALVGAVGQLPSDVQGHERRIADAESTLDGFGGLGLGVGVRIEQSTPFNNLRPHYQGWTENAHPDNPPSAGGGTLHIRGTGSLRTLHFTDWGGNTYSRTTNQTKWLRNQNTGPFLITNLDDMSLGNVMGYTNTSSAGTFPPFGSKYAEVINFGNVAGTSGSNWVVQFLTPNEGNSARTFIRKSTNFGPWSTWSEFYTQESVQVVKVASGTSIRYPDGLQICRHQLVMDLTLTFAEGNVFRTAHGVQWNYPQSFIGVPDVTCNVGAYTSSEARVWLPSVGSGQSSTNHRAVCGISGIYPGVTLNFTAIGFWK